MTEPGTTVFVMCCLCGWTAEEAPNRDLKALRDEHFKNEHPTEPGWIDSDWSPWSNDV